jgi:hypothetical protein
LGKPFNSDSFDTPLESFELTLWNDSAHEAVGKLSFPKSFLIQSEQDEEQWHAFTQLSNEPAVSGELRVEFTYRVAKSETPGAKDEHIFEIKIGAARNLATKDINSASSPDFGPNHHQAMPCPKPFMWPAVR